MKVSYAASCGAFMGILIAIAICVFREISFQDTCVRMLVLGGGGAWMGMLLAWLNHLLTPEQKPQGRM